MVCPFAWPTMPCGCSVFGAAAALDSSACPVLGSKAGKAQAKPAPWWRKRLLLSWSMNEIDARWWFPAIFNPHGSFVARGFPSNLNELQHYWASFVKIVFTFADCDEDFVKAFWEMEATWNWPRWGHGSSLKHWWSKIQRSKPTLGKIWSRHTLHQTESSWFEASTMFFFIIGLVKDGQSIMRWLKKPRLEVHQPWP